MNFIDSYLRKFAIGAAVCLLTISTSMSDDIDVYVAPPPEATVGETLVVFTLDVRPNVMASTVCTNNECDALFAEVEMSDRLNDDGSTSFFLMLVAVLKKVLRDIDSEKIKVALMIPHADTTGGNKECTGFQNTAPELKKRCSNGAYVLSGFKSTAKDPNTNEYLELDQFFKKMESIPLKDGGNWSHPYQLKELFFEMYRYVSAGRVFNGQNGWNNFGTDSEFNIDHDDDTISTNPDVPEPAKELIWDSTAMTTGVDKKYINTLDDAEHCTSIFSVNVTFANASQDNDSNDAIEADFGFRPDNSSKGEEQVLGHLANTDLAEHLVGSQNITSYFVTRAGGAANRANNWARAGGTGTALVFEDDPNELVRLLSGLFNEIKGVSTTFVAASVPANVFNRAETLNEVFLAVFDPNPNELAEGATAGGPFWVGNVKKLTTTTVEEVNCEDPADPETCTTRDRRILVDVLEAEKDNPNSAINPLDGRIRPGALTYWTQTGANNELMPPPVTEKDEKEFTEGTDGRKVDRGGAGQVKPGFIPGGEPGEINSTANTTISGPRKLFTESSDGTNTTLVDLDADSNQGLFVTAIQLLEDSRYGDILFQTVMEDCADCPDDYSSANESDKETARLRVNNLIRHARGYDVGLDTPAGETNGKRPWWQADPLHSRPLALNYGARDGFTVDRPDIRVMVSGNDGLVQMIRDGRTADGTETGAEDGVEAWAFLPQEFVPLQKRLLEGTLGLYNPGVPIADGEEPRVPLHPYAMDGAPSALIIDNNLDGTIDTADGDQAYVFIGQRRGGKRFYALDVSNPDDPEFLWSIDKDDASGDFTEMGQSWSLVRTGIMWVDESGVTKRRPVAIFSGGYKGDDGGDGAGGLGKDSRVEDINGEIVGTEDDEGSALFIVNALTGELIWKAVGSTSDAVASETVFVHPELEDSVAASPTILDATGDGVIDRVYFADTGGNVWRMDATGPSRSNWGISKLFEGGRHYQSDNANDRRFFHAPDIVLAEDENGIFDAVILTSGDRAHPLGTRVENFIYMIKDRGNNTVPIRHNDLADLSNNCLQDESVPCDSSVADNIEHGWKVKLDQCEAGGSAPDCGEKGLASPLTIRGTIFFTTYLPVLGTAGSDTDEPPTTCGTQEGGGLLYALDLKTAGGTLVLGSSSEGGGTPARFERLDSPGIPPNVVAISPDEILRPDLKIQETEGLKSGKTFWYDRRFD